MKTREHRSDQLYDWDELLKRPSFRLYRWRDYRCRVDSIVQQVRNAASLRGIKVSVDVGRRDLVRVTVTDRNGSNGKNA